MRTGLVILLIVVIFADCKKPYSPRVVASSVNYLVVEGVINSSSDSTFIKLSRTVNIANNTLNPETNAQVTVESDQNNIYTLIQTITPGTYAAAGLNLNNTEKYRLRIKTSDNKEYLSDFEAVKNTPPIDSIGYNIKNNGIQIYINTHDPANNTRYYRWDYVETWQFHAQYYSNYKILYKPSVPRDTIVGRTINEQIYYCFENEVSTSVILGSSADLKQDVIYQSPITNIPSSSEKLELKYSILLKQYALTKEAFNFWTNLKKNTEQLGSIFDALPSQISGNIHCISNPSEAVIGDISVTNVQTKRIFISNNKLPQSFETVYPYQCEQDSTLFFNPISKSNDVESFLFDATPGSVYPISAISGTGGIIGYMRADAECSNCTLRGVTKQPAFWK
jgi:hypothetical protein